jgi:hypothetical protein
MSRSRRPSCLGDLGGGYTESLIFKNVQPTLPEKKRAVQKPSAGGEAVGWQTSREAQTVPEPLTFLPHVTLRIRPNYSALACCRVSVSAARFC